MTLHQPSTEEVPLPPLTSGFIVRRVSVGSDVHPIDFSFICTHAQQNPFFVYLKAFCLLVFAKAENFVKYIVIYILQLYFSTL